MASKEDAQDTGFTEEDFKELFEIYAGEYNSEKIHDRILVFDVVKDDWSETCVATTSTCSSQTEPDVIKSTTNDENADVERSTTSADLECVLEQNEEGSVLLPEVTNLSRRKRASEEEEDTCNPSSKKPREGFLESESDNDREVETASIDTLNTGSLLPREDVIPVDADARVDAKKEAVVEMNAEPQPSSQTSSNPSQVYKQHKIFVHTSWLAVHSEYFRALFYSGMKESTAKEVHMLIPESEEKGHLMMLEAIYRPSILDTISVDQLLFVLELADKYNVRFVFRKCKYVLHAMELSVEICEKIMDVIQVKHSMTNVSDLFDKVQEFLVEEFSYLDSNWQTQEFQALSEASLKCLLSSDNMTIYSENTVFHALMVWIESNNIPIGELGLNSHSLLTFVRFELMSIDYLYNFVQHHPIATKMAHFADLYLKGITYHALPERIRKDVKPVKRKMFFDQVPAKYVRVYTWKIEKDQLKILKNGTAQISSALFWSCGYRMRMTLKKENACASGFHAIINLMASGLPDESEFKVLWYYQCYNFDCIDTSGRHVFSKTQKEIKRKVVLLNVTELFSIYIYLSPPILGRSRTPTLLPGSFLRSLYELA